MKKISFNRTRLSEMIAGSHSSNKIDLVVELDFLGTLNIEGKYLQNSIIPWLIAQVKLLEIDKRITSCCIEISVTKNSIIGYESSNVHGSGRNEFLNHRLTSIFKLCTLTNDENYFAYFYKQKNSTVYTLHVFYTNKSNLAKFLSDLQVQAIRLHENQSSYEKLFEFELGRKFSNINKEQFDDPIFLKTLLTTHIKSTKYQNDHHTKKRTILKLTPNRLYLNEANEKTIEKDYSNILYLNCPIANYENYFCLVYSQTNSSKKISIVILFSDDVAVINDAINSYSLNISSEKIFKSNEILKVHSHICTFCPMQQFCDLCEYLNEFISQPEKIYKVLVKILETNLDMVDQNYLFDCLNERNLCLNPPLLSNFEQNVFIIQTNQLIVSLIHKLCKMKQNQHMIFNIRNKTENNSNNTETSEKTSAELFLLMKSINKSKSFNPIMNNIPEIALRRRNTIESGTFTSSQCKLTFIDLFLEKNPFQLKKIHSSNNHSNNITPKNKDTIRSVIFYKIVGTPNNSNSQNKSLEMNRVNSKRFRTSLDIRQFWKKVISEQILLNKMESENKKQLLKHVKKNVDNTYLEITPCLKNIEIQWDSWLRHDEQLRSFNEVHEALFKGVPQIKRGKVWLWLIKQHKLVNIHITLRKEFLFTDLSYNDLLRQSTIHQHSILLDLGRTFPSHPNFSNKLGTGQLALFNVLKAYSIMDPEVGYCQGLSFIVGILLIHVDNSEEEAFEMLKFLLVDLNIREQYKPNMHALQKYMYQFSRLIYEKTPEIYTHLDLLEISSSLYAASWFLTFFSSTFQIGFVARVFDFLFHQGLEILFNISLTVLMIHKPILLINNDFESVVEHLKNIIPEMSLIESELIINRSFDLKLKPLLDKYEIEFQVISEEMEHFPVSSVNDSNKTKENETYISSLEAENITLKDQLKSQFDAFKINQLKMENQEETLIKLDHENRQLKCRVKTFEIERQVMLEKIKNQENLINSNYCT